MTNTQARRRRRQRGSALLLTLLLTVVGGMMVGLTVDATSLLWARSNAQTTANAIAAAVALEMEHRPGAELGYLVETARAAGAWNGYRHGKDSVTIHLEQQEGKTAVLVERDAEVFFMKAMRPHPVAIRARAEVISGSGLAGL